MERNIGIEYISVAGKMSFRMGGKGIDRAVATAAGWKEFLNKSGKRIIMYWVTGRQCSNEGIRQTLRLIPIVYTTSRLPSSRLDSINQIHSRN